MNWFQQNRFLGGFLGALGLATVLALFFLFHEKGAADEQQARLETTMNELRRLRSGKPFPAEANYQKSKAQVESYRRSLGSLATELKERTLPIAPLQPNEFQAQLRQAVNSVIESASAAKVQLPENFYLGFEEYATSLPNSAAAPLLGRELQAITMIVNGLVSAQVDSLSTLVRAPLPEEKATPAPSPTPAASRAARARPSATPAVPAVVTTDTVDLTFSASAAATRRVLNQLATVKEQLVIIRTLNVKNQVEAGPKREVTGATPTAPPAPAPGASPGPARPAVTFIVGGEHLDVAAKIEIVSLHPDAGQTR